MESGLLCAWNSEQGGFRGGRRDGRLLAGGAGDKQGVGGGPELLPPKEAAIWEGGNDGSLEKYISSYL